MSSADSAPTAVNAVTRALRTVAIKVGPWMGLHRTNASGVELLVEDVIGSQHLEVLGAMADRITQQTRDDLSIGKHAVDVRL